MRWISGMTGLGGDDSLRLHAEGFWNDSAVSSHGGSSVHTHQRAVTQQTTGISYVQHAIRDRSRAIEERTTIRILVAEEPLS